MVRKHFQHNADNNIDKATSVDFTLEYDGNNVIIENIQLHSNYDSGLPHSATMEHNDNTGIWTLRAYYWKEIKGVNTKIAEWLSSPLAKEIAQKIIKVRDEETPRFGKN